MDSELEAAEREHDFLIQQGFEDIEIFRKVSAEREDHEGLVLVEAISRTFKHLHLLILKFREEVNSGKNVQEKMKAVIDAQTQHIKILEAKCKLIEDQRKGCG